ncbi:hypothetical protein L2E82_45788 [Cichorium intybus]|uniref:Uncharacterized protein n=1 Tax=Cichorium intybus TaxID=13427 RepID=A0ACB8ZU13_CICIN|nr:hypothetical protein L2E82_45788 [Cichorium intybus]
MVVKLIQNHRRGHWLMTKIEVKDMDLAEEGGVDMADSWVGFSDTWSRVCNNISGTVPESLKSGVSLRVFDISKNNFSDVLLIDTLLNLSSLKILMLAFNNFVGVRRNHSDVIGASSSWVRALVKISAYTFSTIGIAILIGVSVLGAAWGIYIDSISELMIVSLLLNLKLVCIGNHEMGLWGTAAALKFEEKMG